MAQGVDKEQKCENRTITTRTTAEEVEVSHRLKPMPIEPNFSVFTFFMIIFCLMLVGSISFLVLNKYDSSRKRKKAQEETKETSLAADQTHSRGSLLLLSPNNNSRTMATTLTTNGTILTSPTTLMMSASLNERFLYIDDEVADADEYYRHLSDYNKFLDKSKRSPAVSLRALKDSQQEPSREALDSSSSSSREKYLLLLILFMVCLIMYGILPGLVSFSKTQIFFLCFVFHK